MKLVGMGDSAASLLELFKVELTKIGVSVPKLVYVGAGEIPWDAESLTIYLGHDTQGLPGRPTAGSYYSVDAINLSATFYVQLLRTVATVGIRGQTVKLPSAEQMNEEGLRAINDAGALIAAAIAIKGSGVVVPQGIDFAIGEAMPLGPQGGMAAVRLGLVISVEGS